MLWLACLQTAFAQTQLLGNEGFESTSSAPWVLQGAGVQIATGSGAYDGSQYLSMGNARGGVQEVYQTFTFPTNLIGATLTLANETVSSDPNGDDSFSIFLTDTALDPLLELASTTSATTASWGYSSTNFITYQGSNLLSSFAGKKVDLLFYVIPDSTYGNLTSFNVDDVSLVVGTTADIPANDDFTNAIMIPSDGITNVVTTTYASREAGEPDIVTKQGGGHSLWWTWTSPAIGTVTITTSDADFYALLGVYTGSSISNLTVVTNCNGYKLSTGLASVKFNVTAGAQYQITLDGYNGESGSADLALKFAADTIPPKVTIASPTAGERWSNSVFNVTGKVKDTVAVTAVWYQLNSNAWTELVTNINTTNGWTNWNAEVTLTPGTNTFKACAVDTAGNVSPTNSVRFIYVLSAPFKVQINGLGKISPDDTNVLLQISNNYTLTATAGKGFVFSNWLSNAGVESNRPALKFTMVSNLSYTLNFITNPFTPAVGTYQGLFYNTNTNGVAQASSGFFSAQVNANGSFTAKFQQGSKSFPVSGQFSLTGGWATNSLKSWDGTAISLQLNLTNGDVLEGSLSNAAWRTEAELGANRAVFSGPNHAPQAGKKYTMILPPGTNSAALPGGNGFGSVSVNTSGGVTFSGALGDGTKVTASATEASQSQWPFYLSLYSGNGMMLGWLSFITNEPDRDIDGQLFWFKLIKPVTTLYPAGFTNEIRAAGSAYSYKKGVAMLNLTNGNVILTNGGLTQDITNPFVLGANNVVTGSNKLHLTFATSTGLFQGTTTNAEGKTISISGAVLQKQTNGYGLFLNGDQSGSVSITNQ
jgi:hypothetical protein